jgi:hypothetical protein
MMKKMWCKAKANWSISRPIWVVLFLGLAVATSYGQYNGECWVVSGGDTIYKLYANGQADPTVIPNLMDKQIRQSSQI